LEWARSETGFEMKLLRMIAFRPANERGVWEGKEERIAEMKRGGVVFFWCRGTQETAQAGAGWSAERWRAWRFSGTLCCPPGLDKVPVWLVMVGCGRV